jgi:phosphoserine phosphatase RsbU/P
MHCTRSSRLLGRLISALLPALLSFVLLSFLCGPLFSQNFDASKLRQPADLNGVWLIQAGDDPAFASPTFDDSQWTHFDVDKLIKPLFPDSRPTVLWYRLHVQVNPAHTDLALMEHQISSAFQVFENGKLLIHAGTVAPFVPHSITARLLAPIPLADIQSGSLVIAIRVHISPYEWGGSGPGYAASNLFLGQLEVMRDRAWLALISEYTAGTLVLLAGMALGIVALALFWSQPGHREYLWIFLQFFTACLVMPINAYEMFHTVPVFWDQAKLAFQFGGNFFSIIMYFAFLRLRLSAWMRIFLFLSGLGVILFFIASTEGWLSVNAAQTALLPLAFFAFGVVPVLLLIHWRRGNAEAGILLIPSLLTGLAIYTQLVLFVLIQIPATSATAVRIFAFFTNWQIGPYAINSFNLCTLLFVLSLSIIMVLRSTQISRQQAMLESEMAAAREVQKVILPETNKSVPGFEIETAYVPAQQLGGDFYQILPALDGGLLLVIGDVAGKGLPAAMLVSVLVGAIRGVADYTHDPAEMLANLNERLVGRGGSGFSTAMAARFNAGGSVDIASAGHLPPYLDGVELPIPGALPLGVESGIRYQASEFHLRPGSRLTFYSDGVVEAQNQKGELLGFDRGLALSTQPAQAIVEAARRFGQMDDITVVTIQRSGSPTTAPETIAGMVPIQAT